MTANAPHIMVLDPQPERRDLLRTFLRRNGFLVSLARDTDHAGRLLSGLEFDLILLDSAEECDGLCDLTDSPTLWLVGPDETRKGEVLAKPYEPNALVTRLNLMLDRRPPPPKAAPKVLRLGRLRYEVESGALRDGDTALKLTSTEVKLMRALAERPDAPVTRAELGDAVGETDPGSRAVDVQITRLRRKLEADPKMPKVLQTVRGTGYMLVTS